MFPKHVRIQRGDRGSGDPLENHKNIGFLSNTGPVKVGPPLTKLSGSEHANIVFILVNSADPDEMPLFMVFHQGLHCLPIKIPILPAFRMK